MFFGEEVPDCGVEAGEGAADVGPREFVVCLDAGVDEGIDVGGVGAEGVGCDFAVEDSGGDVGVIGRDLAEALGAVVGSDADDADVAVCKGLEGLNFQAGGKRHNFVAAL